MSNYLRAVLALFLIVGWECVAQEVIPPAPKQYFNDYTGWTKQDTAKDLEAKLKAAEKETGAQLVVVVFSKMQSDKPIADYCRRVANTWGIGHKAKNNGLVLFVFKDDRKLWLATGKGLEKVVTDLVAKAIVDKEITPLFKKGDPDKGLRQGVAAMVRAVKGDYKASMAQP